MNLTRKMKIGLVVNPFAGIGGEAGLKGSDGMATRLKALSFNNTLKAPKRLKDCLDQLDSVKQHIIWYTAEGRMGHDYLPDWPSSHIVYVPQLQTTAEDTKALVSALLIETVDLIVFVGGDGTARDVLDIVSTDLPCLGIPSGVKMQSAVFAISPTAAAEIIKGLLQGKLIACLPQDVRDIDEAALREGQVKSQYYGTMLVPDEPRYMQNLKQGGIESEPLVMDDIADQIEQIMDEGHLLIIGPGSTTDHFMQRQGVMNTLVGFDAIKQGKLVANDLNAKDVLRFYQSNPDLKVVLSPTGQQGILLGRGNQQLCPDFLKQLHRDQFIIIASKSKITSLSGRPLLVDTGDRALDEKFCGLYPVITGYDDAVFYPVNTVYSQGD